MRRGSSSRPGLNFYGHFTGWSSFPVVSRALARWLAGQLGTDLRICNLRVPDVGDDSDRALVGIRRLPDQEGHQLRTCMKRLEHGELIRRGGKVVPSFARDSHIGTALIFAFPAWSWAIPKHDRLIGYHVCDVTPVPDHWAQAINAEASLVLTPSSWCAKVLADSGVQGTIRVVPHGIDPDVFKPLPETYPPRNPPVLRFFCSSNVSNRKGVVELAKALRIVRGRGVRASVIVRGGGPIVKAFAGVPDVTFEPDSPVSPTRFVELLHSCDLVLAPSRAEGFGLIPLQAVACGVPVVMTACTGHGMFAPDLQGAAVIVPHGKQAPCPPGPGYAPSLDPEALAGAVVDAILDLEGLAARAKQRADTIRMEWSWDAALSRSGFLRHLQGARS